MHRKSVFVLFLGLLLLVPSAVTYRCYWRLKHIVRKEMRFAATHQVPMGEITSAG